MKKRIASLTALTVFVLAGCGGSKLSAGETAHWMERNNALAGTHVRCWSASNGWDYYCKVKMPDRAPFVTEVDVNERQVTNASG